MLNHILAPMDGSSLAESVLPHLGAVARAFEARVTLLRVLGQSGSAGQSQIPDPLEWHIKRAEAEAYLNGLTGRLQSHDLKATSVLLEGQAAEQITDFAHENDVGLLLVSSHGSSGLSSWNVSSIVQKVILGVHTSIMIVRAYQPAVGDLASLRYGRILVPTDGSQRAEAVLPFVSALAGYYDSKVLLVHVVKEPEMPRQTPPTAEDLELARRLVERNREEAAKHLEQLQSRLPVNVETRLLVSENVTATLHKLVKQERLDLVALSAHGYSGQPRWPYGSLPLSFIAYGTTPLLILQDIPSNQLEPTEAEIAAKEHKGH